MVRMGGPRIMVVEKRVTETVVKNKVDRNMYNLSTVLHLLIAVCLVPTTNRLLCREDDFY